jgi:hypothetical protein
VAAGDVGVDDTGATTDAASGAVAGVAGAVTALFAGVVPVVPTASRGIGEGCWANAADAMTAAAVNVVRTRAIIE